MSNLIITMGFGQAADIPDGVLSQSSLMVNVKRSLDKYIYDNLDVNQNMNVDYEGLPFDNIVVTEWIIPRIKEMPRQYHRQGSDTEYAQTNNVLYDININVKKSGATTTDRHYILRDDVINYFRIGQDISLRDYAASGSTLICYMRVRDLKEDNPQTDDPDLMKYKIGLELDFTEMVTNAV